eukprot:scaffold6009_cov248-Pinguiococcus_pyrenoidosus.AAC.1
MLRTGHGSPTRAPVVTCVAEPRARPSRGSESRDFCLRACRDPSATPRNLSSLPVNTWLPPTGAKRTVRPAVTTGSEEPRCMTQILLCDGVVRAEELGDRVASPLRLLEVALNTRTLRPRTPDSGTQRGRILGGRQTAAR